MRKILGTVILAMALLFTSTTADAASTTYTVKKGDTLYRIATTYKVSVANLKSWNNLKTNTIKINQKLKIVKPAKSVSRSNSSTVVNELYVNSTAYTAYCAGCSGITKTGINLRKNPHLKVIAVDPSVIPLGTKVYVEGYGYAIAGDIGSAIKGNKIDVFFPTKSQAYNWGRKKVKIKILD
ncbi:3D domain-containing protein [Chryseomicrobium palamuruense]|uniref:3D domain-containing protein n=1 Tax=Chryseomicrobium palamuruense TaxID=682973 RepID=A0ABV8UWZ9_9BACL